MTKSFLDLMLTSRLGMRLLCEHHLKLHDAKVGNALQLLICNYAFYMLLVKIG